MISRKFSEKGRNADYEDCYADDTDLRKDFEKSAKYAPKSAKTTFKNFAFC